MKLRFAGKKDAAQIAKIHKTEINKGFLSFLGIPFLKRFYEAVIFFDNSFCFVATKDGGIVGFVAGTVDLKKFNKFFFKKYFPAIFLIIASKIFSPFVRRKIRENFLHIKKNEDLPPAELISIAIDKNFHGRGLGSELIRKLVQEMRAREVKSFKVLVGRELNLGGFYTKNGFKLLGGAEQESSLIFIFDLI